MKFEEAIQTTKFPTENLKVQLNIIHTASVLECSFTAWFKIFDLTMQQYNVMRIVRGQSPKAIMVKDITARIIYKNCNTTRIIDKLESKMLLERVIGDKDKRAIYVNLTQLGFELMAKIDIALATGSPHLKVLEESEAEVLGKLLDKMRNGFEEAAQCQNT